jgi:cell division protein FtsL
MSEEPTPRRKRWVEQFILQFAIDWRIFVIACLTLGLSLAMFFILLRVGATYRIESELALVRQHVIDQSKELEGCKAQTVKELSDITATVYGPMSKARRPSTIESWSKNRDKELRERIRQLELWRMRMEQ